MEAWVKVMDADRFDVHGVTFRLGFVTGATPDKWVRVWRERQREPIELVPVTEDVQEDGVRGGELDMALVRLPVDRDGLHLIPLYEELPVAVMGVEHVLTLLEEVTTEDLADEHQDWTGRRHQGRRRDGGGGHRRARGAHVHRPAAPPQGRHLPDGDRPATDPVGLAWLVDNDDPRVQTFIGIVRGRSERSSRA